MTIVSGKKIESLVFENVDSKYIEDIMDKKFLSIIIIENQLSLFYLHCHDNHSNKLARMLTLPI